MFEEYFPDLVILYLGDNVILRRFARGAVSGNLNSMVALIKPLGADVILVVVPEFEFFCS